jgi:primase-polymerase (primpol)-like protein
MLDKIPDELKALRQWLLWKMEARDGRMTKVPYQPNGRRANVTAPRTWNTFDVCVRALRTGRFLGIGFVFTKGPVSYAGVDLDKCRDPQTGMTEQWAIQIIKELGSYTELSQSKTGWHIIVKNCGLPVDGGRNKRVEMYCSGRYFCMTGDRAAGCTEIRSVSLANLYQRMVEDKLDPTTAKAIHGRRINGSDTSPSGDDYKIIASLARKLRTDDVVVIESEIARRHRRRYQDQSGKHGDRKGQTYWRYSIVRYFERRRLQTASEAASRLGPPTARFESTNEAPTLNIAPPAPRLKAGKAGKIRSIPRAVFQGTGQCQHKES